MNPSALLFSLAVLVLGAPAWAADAPAHTCAALRLPYLDGMQQMLQPMCDVACAGQPQTCMPRCMEPSLMSTDPKEGGDEAVCNVAGGILQTRMPSCQSALNELLTLHNDSSVAAGLHVVANIYRACSVQVLCGADDPE